MRFATGLAGGALPGGRVCHQQLADTEEIKIAIRDSGSILALMRKLKQAGFQESELEFVMRALTHRQQ